MFKTMEISQKDLGKIVHLPARKEWGSGIICKMDMRCVYVLFDTAEGPAKKFFMTNNPLKLAANQDQPHLVKRGRMKNRKIKVPVKIFSPEGVALEGAELAAATAKDAATKIAKTVKTKAAKARAAAAE
jgi:hypothetical protein